jgi:hypothetical protein
LSKELKDGSKIRLCRPGYRFFRRHTQPTMLMLKRLINSKFVPIEPDPDITSDNPVSGR